MQYFMDEKGEGKVGNQLMTNLSEYINKMRVGKSLELNYSLSRKESFVATTVMSYLSIAVD